MSKILALTALLSACAASPDSTSTAEQKLSTNPNACITEASGLGRLNCTAEDVRVSRAISIRIDGTDSSTTCVEGTTIPTLVGTFEVINTAARLDPRFFFATAGQGTALTGTCSSNVIQPVVLDLDGDQCGDIEGTQLVEITLHDVLCTAGSGGQLSLPVATSWRIPGSDTVCSTFLDTAAGTKSKCNEDAGFTVPITVVPPSSAVTKALVAQLCTTLRYSTTVVNTSITQTLSLTSLVDSTYGDLLSVHGPVVATTCAATVLPVGGSMTCTFDAVLCAGSETDTITATLDDGAGTVLTPTSNALTVTTGATAQ